VFFNTREFREALVVQSNQRGDRRRWEYGIIIDIKYTDCASLPTLQERFAP